MNDATDALIEWYADKLGIWEEESRPRLWFLPAINQDDLVWWFR